MSPQTRSSDDFINSFVPLGSCFGGEVPPLINLSSRDPRATEQPQPSTPSLNLDD